MSQYFQIHPENPQKRLIDQAIMIIRKGGVVAYPTDSGYALGCHLGEKKAIEKIKWLRSLDDKHNFTLVCSDLSEIGTYAKVDNDVFRLLKAHTQGPIPIFWTPRLRCRGYCCTPSVAPLACACPITVLRMRYWRR
ncbi:hypothetical protein HSBAA_11130 [Vreelandella sulfidaeris]|uniref:YrdC-like domain-containing protein n=1 Tax=Vreelandella sulfidaeris TaxID=115553 RepID=A0A455U2E3_9GAMM|nr:hypothetical protein HSBAA_11130 [Halomonas sulfidaeris]